MSMTAELQHYRAVGLIEKWGGTADCRVRAGTCWHCGTAIAYCVQIQSSLTGEQHEIGSTCAEKLGLDITQIKQQLADQRAAERLRTNRLHCSDPVLAPEQPHGTVSKFNTGCYCLQCIDAALTAMPKKYAVGTKSVIIELATGRPVRATLVNTRYGQSWHVDDGTWLTAYPRPKRRNTQAAKGYVEAEVPCLFRYGWQRRGGTAAYSETTLCPLASPLVDVWGMPIEHGAEHARAS